MHIYIYIYGSFSFVLMIAFVMGGDPAQGVTQGWPFPLEPWRGPSLEPWRGPSLGTWRGPSLSIGGARP